ncbi:hypothetical protein D3C85_1435680 [compost metagenome]
MRNAGDIPQTDHVGLGNSFLEVNLKEVCWLADRHREQARSQVSAFTRDLWPLKIPVGASLLAMALCQAISVLWVYISVAAVTATQGSALTAGHLEKPQVTKGSCPFRSVPRLGSACPRSGPAPWARRHRPSMAGGG